MRIREFPKSPRRWISWLGALLVSCSALAQPAMPTRQAVAPYMNGNMPATDSPAVPALLSLTGTFTNTAALTAAPSLLPYSVNSPFWSDGADKNRFVAVPNDGPPYSGAEVVNFSPSGEWSFPNGTVFVKHFELVVNKMTGERRRVETRVLVRDAEGGIYGRSYRWRPNNSDADVVSAAVTEDISIIQADGSARTQTWLYPSPNQCLDCHNFNAKYVLGLNTRQVNGELAYSTGGPPLNQLQAWSAMGMFDTALNPALIPSYTRMVPIGDNRSTLESRVRSYLDANCSSCHRGTGNGPGPLFDARFSTPVLEQKLFTGALTRFNIAASRIHTRMTGASAPMPPIGRNVVHAEAAAVIAEWVNHPFDVSTTYSTTRPNELRVAFNRKLDAATALEPSRYRISGNSVLFARLEQDMSTVTLRLAAPVAPATTTKINIDGVRESALPRNATWPIAESVPVVDVPSGTRQIFDVPLTASRVVPAVSSGAGGFASVTFDATTNRIAWTVTARELQSGFSGASFNGSAAAGESGVLALPIAGTSLPLHGEAVLSVSQRNDLLAGRWYLNVKSAALPDGELRGQIVPQIAKSADLSADGRSDLVLGTPSGGGFAYLMNGATVAGGALILAEGTGWRVLRSADFNGDGFVDLLLVHNDGSLFIYLMNGASVVGGGFVLGAGTGWSAVSIGNFDGDANADLLLQHTDGRMFVYLMNGATVREGALLLGPNAVWRAAGVADINGDGRGDLVLKNADGSLFVGLMDGATFIAGSVVTAPGSGWSLSGVGDTSGNGRADLVLSREDGTAALFQLTSLATVQAARPLMAAGSGWSVKRVADVDGDGKADLLWQHQDGSIYVWLLEGASVKGGGFLLGSGTPWRIADAIDLNGDNKADLLLQTAGGGLFAYLLDGSAVVGGGWVLSEGTAWRPLAP